MWCLPCCWINHTAISLNVFWNWKHQWEQWLISANHQLSPSLDLDWAHNSSGAVNIGLTDPTFLWQYSSPPENTSHSPLRVLRLFPAGAGVVRCPHDQVWPLTVFSLTTVARPTLPGSRQAESVSHKPPGSTHYTPGQLSSLHQEHCQTNNM